jgi:hypothetical protein
MTDNRRVPSQGKLPVTPGNKVELRRLLLKQFHDSAGRPPDNGQVPVSSRLLVPMLSRRTS